jgi:photosystem II stability/assembly factor-like uncharacterized protein
MNVYLSLIVVLILSGFTKAQWYPQNSGTANSLEQVFFINENIGWTFEGQKIYKTINGGNDWFLQRSEDSLYLTKIFFITENIGWYTFNTLYPVEHSGVCKTTNGGISWNLQLNTGQFVQLSDIEFTDTLNGWCIGVWQLGMGYSYKTTNGGLIWDLFEGPTLMQLGLFFINSDTGWIAGSTIKRTTNSGLNWDEQLNIEPNFLTWIKFVNSNTGWASGLWYNPGIYKTINGGQIWFQQSTQYFNSIFFTDELNGWATIDSNIYYTTNGGDDWGLQNSNTDSKLRSIFFINQNNGWAVGDNGIILHTANGGTPVELMSFIAGVENDNVTLNWTTATETNNSGFSVESKQVHSLQSTVGNEEWKTISFVNGHGTTTEPQSYSFIDLNLSAGKYQYRLKQIDFDGTFEYSNTIEVEITPPAKFSLEQNYPNPFNPTTKIRFTIPVVETGLALSLLKVYDVLGNEVATLVNEYKTAGNYEVEFDASKLSSGVYYYQLKADEFIQTRKMIILK